MGTPNTEKKRTKIGSKEGKEILKQIQNINIPLYKSFIDLQKTKLSPKKRKAIEKEFIEQYNVRHPTSEGGPVLESIQDYINDPCIILENIHKEVTGAMPFFEALEKVFGPDGVFSLNKLSEEQKFSLLTTLKSFNRSNISDLSDLQQYWRNP